jgi:hypothetical protein
MPGAIGCRATRRDNASAFSPFAYGIVNKYFAQCGLAAICCSSVLDWAETCRPEQLRDMPAPLLKDDGLAHLGPRGAQG